MSFEIECCKRPVGVVFEPLPGLPIFIPASAEDAIALLDAMFPPVQEETLVVREVASVDGEPFVVPPCPQSKDLAKYAQAQVQRYVFRAMETGNESLQRILAALSQ